MPYVALRIPRRQYERLARRAAADQMSLEEWLSLQLRRTGRAGRARVAKA